MKRKNHLNITSSSLRSSSSRRSRKKTNFAASYPVSQRKNQQSSTNSNKNNTTNSRIIGNSSKKSFFCKGCNNTFNIYSSVNTFLNRHVKSNDKCPLAYPKCSACGKIFYEDKHLLSHKSKSDKNSKCYSQFVEHQINTKYSSSEVKKMPINKNQYLPADVPNHLNPLFQVEKDFMVSKMNSDYNSFQPTIKFQNLNIHNSKSTIPHQFLGHATMDPKLLSMKNDINSSGIYTQQPSYHNSVEIGKKSTNDHQQIIDFGDFTEDFDNGSIGVNSDISVSSGSDHLGNTSKSSDSNESNSPKIVTNNHRFTNTIIQEIVENDDNDDDDSITSAKSTTSLEKKNRSNFSDINNNTNETFLFQPSQIPNQQSVDIRDSNHFLRMHSLQSKELKNSICDRDYKDCLELVTILMKYNVPTNGIFDDLMKWENKNSTLTSSSLTMDTLLTRAKNRVHGKSIATKLSPIQTNLICPSGRRINVTSFDVDALIYEMLSDDNLMQHQNLVFSDGTVDNPFKMIESEFYSDFHTSEFYKETIKQKEIDSETDLLVPIQLYLDETTLDSYSKLSLHPLVMTLLIFNRKTRNLSMSWRTVAYIPNFDAIFQSKNYTVDMKYNDFHFCLRYLLNGIEKVINQKDGFSWLFQFDVFPNRTYERKLKFVLGNVLGDAKGSNVLCSRFNNNSTSHIARDCNVLTQNCDNPQCKCTFHKQKDLEALSNDQLRELSFRKITPYNAFSNMDFGANCYGINGACSADPCHMFNKGVVERLPKIFMARLTPKLVLVLDKHVGALITNYGNQSDREFPNIKVFTKGVSSSAKLRSDQHIARVLVIFLVLLTPEFEEAIIHKKGRKESLDESRTRITFEEYNQWIFIFEETLLLHSWVYLDKHKKLFFKGGKNSVICDRLREYMHSYQSFALRKEGMGLKFLKFHQILHLWWIIRLFGSLHNVDTARCESHNKKKKSIGRQTQRRIELFDEQTSLGEYKYNLLIHAIDKAGIPLPKGFEITSTNSNIEQKNNKNDINELKENEETSNSSKYLLTFDYENNSISAKWLSPKMKHKMPDFPMHILNGVYQKFKGYNHGFIGKRIKTITGFTEILLQNNSENAIDTESGKIVRACPYYRGEKNWFDWVSVQWEDYGLLECQCLLFIDFSTIVMEDCDIVEHPYEGCNQAHTKFAIGKAALVHSITQVTIPSYTRKGKRKSFPKNKEWNKDYEESHLVRNRLVRFHKMEDTYHIVSIDDICKTAFVIPYDYIKKDEAYLEGRSDSVMIMNSMSTWNTLFIDYDDVDMITKAKARIDDTIDSSDERFPYES